MADMVLVMCILMSAYFIRGITGFGSALISVPLLALSQPLQFAIPLVLALDFTASLVLGSTNRKKANWSEIKILLPAGMIGACIGAFALLRLPTQPVLVALGAFTMFFGFRNIFGLQPAGRLSRTWAIPAGLAGGGAGALFGAGSPPYIIYLTRRLVDKGEVRATFSWLIAIDGGFRLGYREDRPGPVFRDYNFNFNSFWNFSHEVLDDAFTWESWRRGYTGGQFNLGGRATFRSFHGVDMNLTYRPDQYSRNATRGGPIMIQPGSRGLRFGFDSDRRRLSTLHRTPVGLVLYTKGALETLLPLCSHADSGGGGRPLDATLREEFLHAQEELAGKGLRVLAVAYREVPEGHPQECLEEGLTLAGLVGLEDPPRPEVPAARGLRAVARLAGAGA